MTSNDPIIRVMIVDDSPELIHMLLEDLQGEFAVTAALNAEEALQLLADSERPDIILLDINMPGMNGYEACEVIKSDPALVDIDVIFLSSNNSTEEIARGLAVGGSDYLVKPYSSSVLKTKLAHAQRLREQRLQLRAEAKNANDLVMTVLSETGALGVVVNFLRSSLANETSAQLMSGLLEALSNYGLNAVAYFKAGDILECNATHEISSMLELELIERMHGSDQSLTNIGNKFLLVQRHCVLLIKKMPADEVKRGALQDNLQIILEGVNAKLNYFLIQQRQAGRQQQLINEVMASLSETLTDLRTRQIEHREDVIVLIGELGIDVEKAFFSMGLTEAQEKEILDILTRQLSRLVTQLEAGMQLDDDFTALGARVANAVNKVLL